MILFSRKKMYLIFLLLLTFLLLPQCGLHSFPHLEPPSVQRIGLEIFYITNTNDNPDIFRGYELFYKFHHHSDTSGIANDIRDISSFTQPDPRPLFTRTRRFFRVNTAPDTQSPPTGTPNIFLGTGQRHEGFTIEINFEGINTSSAVNFNPTLRYSNQNILLFRDVTNPDNTDNPTLYYKSFGHLRNINTAVRDADLSPGNDYHITLYLWIFARGIYNNTPIFSKAVELGNITYLRS